MTIGNKFVNALTPQNLNMTATANGALANETTFNECLNLFNKMGNYQTLSIVDFNRLFHLAWKENKHVALRLLFVNRDVRSGQRVKQYFQNIPILGNEELNDWLVRNLHLIPEYGYWKDLYMFYDTPYWGKVVEFWVSQIMEDYHIINGLCSNSINQVSLAAKYAPTESSRSGRLNKLYIVEFLKYFNSPALYRKIIGSLRSHINVVEKTMSQNKWNEVNYSTVPSVAFSNYRKAFERHDAERFNNFLASDQKVNASVLSPIDIVKSYIKEDGEYGDTVIPALEKQWKNLDDVFKTSEGKLLLPVCDCSGSMDGMPSMIANALTIYCAERNVGPFKDLYMEFSRTAKFFKFKENSNLRQKLTSIAKHHDVANTNLISVFTKILEVAINNNVPQSDMPTNVILFSDMQFDTATTANDERNIDVIKDMFKASGYEFPTIIFWNLNSGYDNVPVTIYDGDVLLLSGYSEQLLRYVFLNEAIKSPLDLMLQVVNSERYNVINI